MERLREGLQYFVKNDIIHKYPYARCPVVYTGETLYDDPPIGIIRVIRYEKCDKCFEE